MAIIMRNGLEANFDPNKMRAGELAVVTDARELHVTFAPGDSPKVILDGEAVPNPETAGTEGQVLAIDENGNPKWKNVAAPSDAQVGAAVEDWLDAHPEATTTVQDGAITYAKLDANLKGKADEVDELKNYMADSGWITFTLESGAQAFSNSVKPAVRCIGNRVFLRGQFKNLTTTGRTICTLPVAYRPAMDHVFTTSAISGATVQDTVVITVSATDGTIKLTAVSGTLSSSASISIATSFVAASGYSQVVIYEYMGSVETYSELPTENMNAGDIYTVETADSTAGIAAGDDVMWNGSEWEKFSSVISSSAIDTIIDSIS